MFRAPWPIVLAGHPARHSRAPMLRPRGREENGPEPNVTLELNDSVLHFRAAVDMEAFDHELMWDLTVPVLGALKVCSTPCLATAAEPRAETVEPKVCKPEPAPVDSAVGMPKPLEAGEGTEDTEDSSDSEAPLVKADIPLSVAADAANPAGTHRSTLVV